MKTGRGGRRRERWRTVGRSRAASKETMAIHLMKISGRMPITPMITDPGIIGMRLRFRLYRDTVTPCIPRTDLRAQNPYGATNRYNNTPMGAQVRIATVKTRIAAGLDSCGQRSMAGSTDTRFRVRARAVICFERPLERKSNMKRGMETEVQKDSFLTH